MARMNLRSSPGLTGMVRAIMYVSYVIGTAGIFLLPHEFVDGNYVLTSAPFRGLPFTFYAFLISIILAFSGAFLSLCVFQEKAVFAATRISSQEKAKFARITGYCSVISMASAMALLLWAIIYSSCTSTI